METESSLPHLQQPTTCPYYQPDKSSPCPHPTSWISILISSSHLCLGFLSGLCPSGFPTKILYAPLLSPIRTACVFFTFQYPSQPLISSTFATTRQWSVSQRTSSALECHLLSVIMWSVWLWVFPLGEVQMCLLNVSLREHRALNNQIFLWQSLLF